MASFKQEFPFETRQTESEKIRNKYPDRVPVVIERASKCDLPDLDKKKFLIPKDLSVGNLVYIIRKRIKLAPEQGIYVFQGNTLLSTAALMSVIDQSYKDDDGFLYIVYSGESTFGKTLAIGA